MALRSIRPLHRKRELPTNVLVVEDQGTMRELIRGMLRKNGYHKLVTVENGRQAIGAICSHEVNVVITDWNMPNMTGIELVKWIKADSRFFRLPVMMISDEGSADKVLYALEEGSDGFLVKPFSEVKLIKHLDDMLTKAACLSEMEEKVFEMRLLKLSGEYRKALELGNEILKVRKHPRVVLMTCECLYKIEDYEKAIEMMLDTDEETRTSGHNNLLGKLYISVGRQSEGLMYLEQAVEKNPLNHDRKIDLARAYFSAGKVGEAEKVIEKMMSMNPTDLNLVSVAQLYLDHGDEIKAGLYLDQTVDPIPETVHVFNNYAVALRKANRCEESARIYQKCLQIVPNSDILHYNLGLLYRRIGRLEDAKKVLVRALQLNPNNKHADKLLKDIQSGRAMEGKECDCSHPSE